MNLRGLKSTAEQFARSLFSAVCVLPLLLPTTITSAASAIKDPLVLLVSLDGLRHDFITPELTPNIYELGEQGVFAPQGIKSQVTTVTSANHQCLATGLFQESHGIIDNTFYDPVFDEYFDNWNFTENSTTAERSLLLQWFKGVEPIWRTNMQISGHSSGCYLWPLCDAQYEDGYGREHRFKPWTAYNNYSVWLKEIDELIEWFTDAKGPINLGLYYNAQPDHVQHENDLFGSNVTAVIRQMDQLIGYLVRRAKEVGIWPRLNLILTADHGHSPVPSTDFLFNLSRYIDPKLVKQSSASYFPRSDLGVTAEEIFANLSSAIDDGVHISLWYKSSFPERYHWKKNRRVGPVIAFYDNHYQNDAGGTKAKKRTYPVGTHGYLNDFDEMNPFFVAHGPAFRKHFRLDGLLLENTDIYPLICHILGLKPAPNNGSLLRIGAILTDFPEHSSIFRNWTTSFVLIFAIVIPWLAFFVLIYCTFRYFHANFGYIRLKDLTSSMMTNIHQPARVFYARKNDSTTKRLANQNRAFLSSDERHSTNGFGNNNTGEALEAWSTTAEEQNPPPPGGAIVAKHSAAAGIRKPLVRLENGLGSSDNDEDEL